MAHIIMNWKSRALGKSTEARILFDEHVKPPYAVLYLLHGLSDDASQWSRATSLERYLAGLPLMVVMPDGGRSFYCDSPLGHWESCIVGDLVDMVDRTFPTRTARRYRAIGGLSMGGYGAMKNGLKHYDVFGVIHAHSSAFDFAHDSAELAARIPEISLIEESIDCAANDIYRLAADCPKQKRPKVYFDCGRDDHQFSANERLHKHLAKIGYPHQYRRFPGSHNWAYWDAHIQDALAFLVSGMGLKRKVS